MNVKRKRRKKVTGKGKQSKPKLLGAKKECVRVQPAIGMMTGTIAGRPARGASRNARPTTGTNHSGQFFPASTNHLA